MTRFTDTTRRRFLQAVALLAVPGVSRTAFAQQLSTIDLGGVTVLQGAGGNVVALAGPEGALMIDGGLAAHADALVEAVLVDLQRRAPSAPRRVHTLINTHWHPEQTGANALVGQGGGTILAHEKTRIALSHTIYSSAIVSGRVAPLPSGARPTKVTRSDGAMSFAGRQIDYGYMPAAHTDGDLYVHVPSMNLLAVGGVVAADRWPLLDYRNGAWLGGRVRALERLASLVKPDTQVIPADGPLMTGRDLVRHRDLYQQLFATMIGYLNLGLGPEDAVQRNPLKDYAAEFGDPAPFTYGALRSMMIAYVPD